MAIPSNLRFCRLLAGPAEKMAIFSSLGSGVKRGFVNLAKKFVASPNLKDGIRNMSSQRTMIIQPSRFQYRKFKDLLHLYTLVGAVPLGTLILYVNIFIGPSELAEIPEGYIPQEHEYHSHPIKRWFAKYLYTSDHQYYEQNLHCICALEEKRQINLLEKKIRKLMSIRGDYKGWYYLPATAKYHRIVREEIDKQRNDWRGV